MATPGGTAADLPLLGWQYGKSVLDSLRHLLDTGLGADVSFEVGPRGAEGRSQRAEGGPLGAEGGSQEAEVGSSGAAGGQEGSTPTLVRAHRCILMCRSSVFEELLGGRKAGGEDEQRMLDTKERFPVNDVQPEIFRAVLRLVLLV